MIKCNFHTHSTWCDGKDSPRKMIQAAIAKGFKEIGFSSHAMLPESNPAWGMAAEKAQRYLREIRSLNIPKEEIIRYIQEEVQEQND